MGCTHFNHFPVSFKLKEAWANGPWWLCSHPAQVQVCHLTGYGIHLKYKMRQLIPIFLLMLLPNIESNWFTWASEIYGGCKPFVGDVLRNFPLKFCFHTQHVISAIASHHLPNNPGSLAGFTSWIGAWFSSINSRCCMFFRNFPSIKDYWIFEIHVKNNEKSQVQDLGSSLCQQLCQHLFHLYLCLSEHPWQLGSCDQLRAA